MRPAALFYAAFGVVATAAFLLVGAGQHRKDDEAFRQLRAVTVARGVAFVASSELAELKAFADAPPPPEGQPAPEPPVEGAKTQRYLEALSKTLGVKQAFVLQGTQYWAHTSAEKAKKRLDRDSVEDKALYDRASTLKSAAGKNADERERNPEMKKDAYSEVLYAELDGGKLDRAAVPVKLGNELQGVVEVDLAPGPSPAGLPLSVLWLGLGGILVFVALVELVVKDRLGKAAIGAVVGAGLVALIAAEAQSLSAWREKARRASIEELSTVHGALAKAGLYADGREKLDATPELARGLMGEATTLLGVLPETRSATTSKALSAPTERVVKDGAASYWSKAGLEAEAATDRANLLQWAAGIGLLALIGFGLGMVGTLGRAGAALSEHRSAYLYMMPAALGLLVLVFVPVAFGLAMGFFKKNYGVWEFAGVDNYLTILANTEFTNPQNFYYKLGITVMWTVVNVAAHVGIGLFLALLLNDMMLKARGVYRVILIVPWAIPNYITALIWKGMFHKQFGAVNFFLDALGFEPISWFQTFWPAFTTNVVTNIWLGFPFMMVISLGALQSIPADLYEAARVDGASRWQRFRNITLPLLMPALVPSVIVGTVWTFNMFNIIYLVSGGAPNGATDILITDAFRWAFERSQEGYAAAYSTLIFVILLCFSLATNRITGATKGVFE